MRLNLRPELALPLLALGLALALSAPFPASAAADDDAATTLLASMSLEDKVAQMIMSYPPLDPDAPVPAGAVIFVGNLLRSADSVKSRIEGLQKRARVPLLVAVDMEGGKLNRLKFVKALRTVPSARELGEGDEATARNWGRKVGAGMHSLGFNCNLGPVLDLADSGLMFESGRSMGSDPAKVARLARAYAAGLWSQGVAPVGKHFPGYGDIDRNSDHALVVSDRSPDLIQKQASAFTLTGDELAGVMLANVGFTSYGSIPAILSPELVALAHKGSWLTVTDDLAIKTLSEVTAGDQEEVVRRAFLAGNDMLLTTAPFNWDKGLNVYQVVLDLVKAKPELVSRVDEAALRVLRLKQKMGLLPVRKGVQASTADGTAPKPRPE